MHRVTKHILRTFQPLHFFIGFCVLLLLSACQQDNDVNNDKTDETQTTFVPVQVTHIGTGSIRASFKNNTVLEAEEHTDVIARVTGIVQELFVEEGDWVEQGQPLLQLDPERYQLGVDQIQAELRNIEAELTRNAQLAKEKLVGDDVITRLESQRDALRAQLKTAQLDLEETLVLAPIQGHISHRYARKGMMLQAWQQESSYYIVNDALLRATLHLPEYTRSYLHVGMKVELKLDAVARTVTAQIARINPTIDAKTGTYRITLILPNKDFTLAAGMFARAQVYYLEKQDTLRIPTEALIRIDNQSHVYLVEDGKAIKRDVEIGIQDQDWLEVISGLALDDTLIIAGQHNVREGTDVEVIEP